MEVSPSSVVNTQAEAELNLQDIAREAVNERFKMSPVKDESTNLVNNNNNGSPSQLKSTSNNNSSASTNSKINLLIDTLNLSIKSSMSSNNNMSHPNNDHDAFEGDELKQSDENLCISGSTMSAAETLLKIKQYQPVASLNGQSFTSYIDDNSTSNHNNNNNSCGYNSDKNDDLDFNENENDEDNEVNDEELNQQVSGLMKNKSPLSPPSLSASQSPVTQNDDDEERKVLNELQNDDSSENGKILDFFILQEKL